MGPEEKAPEPARTPSRHDPFLGRTLDDRYRILAPLAKGGMGRVYQAEQAPLGRVVALKVLEPGAEVDVEFRERFVREAAATARLTHPNTVRIFDYGRTWDDVYYIAMEHLQGRTLQAALRADGPMGPEAAIHVARQICQSLREAHQLGMVHRDLKPSNIFLVPTGEELPFVKVLDFGLVKDTRSDADLTRSDAVVGSPSYMSPEQIRSGTVDARSDLYAVGVLLFAMLTGRTPFAGETSVSILLAHLQQAPPSLAEARPGLVVPPILEQVVGRCLEKDPARRFASADELLRALNACLDTIREATPGGPPYGPVAEDPPAVAPPEAPGEVSIVRVPGPRARPAGRAIVGVAVGFVLASLAVAAFVWRLLGPSAPPAAVPVTRAPAESSANADLVPQDPGDPAPWDAPVAPSASPDPPPGNVGPPTAEGATIGLRRAPPAPPASPSPPVASPDASAAPLPPGAPVDVPVSTPSAPTGEPPAATPPPAPPPSSAPSSDLRDPWKDGR